MITKTMIRLGAGLLAAACLSVALAADGTEEVKGTWKLNNWVPGSSVRLTLTHASGTSRWVWGTDYPVSELRGLSKEELRSASSTVKFTLERDPGTFRFEGSMMLGLGHGEFRFNPDPTFRGKLIALGYEPAPDQDLLAMAIRDISFAYASEVMRSGIKGATVGDLGRFRDHGVDLDFIRSLALIGYARLSPDDVVRLKDHGVQTEFLRTLKAAGYGDLTGADIVKLRDHGVDSDYIEGLQDVGRGKLTANEIVKLREHGVDPGYVARVESAGFTGLTVDQLIRLREHGID